MKSSAISFVTPNWVSKAGKVYPHCTRAVGASEGVDDGLAEGKALGVAEGNALGLAEGKALGVNVGYKVGKLVGALLGKVVGWADGSSVGKGLGPMDGEAVKETSLSLAGKPPLTSCWLVFPPREFTATNTKRTRSEAMAATAVSFHFADTFLLVAVGAVGAASGTAASMSVMMQ